MKYSLLLLCLCVATSSHARFTQQDTWAGIDRQPITLNKYLYANSDPANNTDPTGRFSISGQMAAVSGFGILATAATYGVGQSLLTGTTGAPPNYGSGNTGRKWSIWDIIAANHLAASVALATAVTATSTRQRSPNDGHHTIPIYLCGSKSQKLSSINRAQHRALHTGLAAVQVALTTAEKSADRLIPLTRRRSGPIMSLAETPQGRGVISNAIQGFYQTAGFWGQGTPQIGHVFPQERREFIDGKTSLPGCKRKQ